MSYTSEKRIYDLTVGLDAFRTFSRDFANNRTLNPVNSTAQQLTFTRSGTATRVNQLGVIETVSADTPRFDFDPVTKVCKGLLLEETRTNNLLYSEDLTNAAWSKTSGLAVTITSNATTAPDNTSNADLVVTNIGNGQHKILQTSFSSAMQAAGAVTLSAFVKIQAGAVTSIKFGCTDLSTGDANCLVNLSTGIVTDNSTGGSWTNKTFGSTDYGNGWWRIWMTATKISTSGVGCYFEFNGQGDGSTGWYMWGTQIETGSFITSYIPTTSAAVTRGTESCNITESTGSSIYNEVEGTLLVSFYPLASTSTLRGPNFNSSSNVNVLGLTVTTSAATGIVRKTEGASDYVIGGGATLGVLSKIAVSHSTGVFKGCFNGGSIVTASTNPTGTPISIKKLDLATDWDALSTNGWITSVIYYRKQFSSRVLTAITTL